MLREYRLALQREYISKMTLSVWGQVVRFWARLTSGHGKRPPFNK
jgi:hypothetical protein